MAAVVPTTKAKAQVPMTRGARPVPQPARAWQSTHSHTTKAWQWQPTQTRAVHAAASKGPGPEINANAQANAKALATEEQVNALPTAKDLAGTDSKKKPFKAILAANRGEIAARICRAGEELGMKTVAVYVHEDRYSAHRWGADMSFELPARATPTGGYLDPMSYIEAAKKGGAEAIHPGYGFLSESPALAPTAPSTMQRRRSNLWRPLDCP